MPQHLQKKSLRSDTINVPGIQLIEAASADSPDRSVVPYLIAAFSGNASIAPDAACLEDVITLGTMGNP